MPELRSWAIALLLLNGCDSPGPEPEPEPDTGVEPTPDTRTACDDGDAPPTSALAFDGVDDYVSMGPAAGLGLATFTLEAWVRRDGDGQPSGTGAGGVTLVPIAGKGRGEHDGSNVDCNYAFGLHGDVLGADFEDMASGKNHPVVGVTAVPRGEWHHVAVSYDGTTWRLYLDGVLDAEEAANATPRADSIQHFAIGALLDSTGTPAGRFHGAIDEVRVWDRARTAEELRRDRFRRQPEGPGLRARWALDDGETGAPDSAGAHHGTLAGNPAYTSPGAVLDQGLPPTLGSLSPPDRADVTGAVQLGLEVTDPDSTALMVTFHARELTENDDFTVVVLPDTQFYTVQGSGLEQHFYDQTRWVMDNREAYDIAAVIHNGDITDHGSQKAYEWKVADRAMKTLETTSAALPEGLPYGVCVGNHDQKGGTGLFNQYFGISRFQGRSYYGGHYGSNNDESWFTFRAGGLDFVVVNLQFDLTPDAAVLAWARSIFEAHPEHFGILNSHFLVDRNDAFSAQGSATYQALKATHNVQLMTSGHVTSENLRSDTFEGHTIHSMLADYQGRARGGSGWMRIWEFSPANDELTVRTYSPSLDRWETDANSEFTLKVDLSGAGGAFAPVAQVSGAAGPVTATFEGVQPGRVYEWYASVTDCAHTVRTPVRRFTTPP